MTVIVILIMLAFPPWSVQDRVGSRRRMSVDLSGPFVIETHWQEPAYGPERSMYAPFFMWAFWMIEDPPPVGRSPIPPRPCRIERRRLLEQIAVVVGVAGGLCFVLREWRPPADPGGPWDWDADRHEVAAWRARRPGRRTGRGHR